MGGCVRKEPASICSLDLIVKVPALSLVFNLIDLLVFLILLIYFLISALDNPVFFLHGYNYPIPTLSTTLIKILILNTEDQSHNNELFTAGIPLLSCSPVKPGPSLLGWLSLALADRPIGLSLAKTDPDIWKKLF